MKHKLKQTQKKYLIIPIAAVGLIAMLAFASVDTVKAHGFSNNKENLAEMIAQKFNLDQQTVEDTMQEFHQNQMEQRLEAAVQEDRITQAQRYAILEKHEEMYDRMEELRNQDLSPEDMRELRADIHEEMQAWAEEQGIDFEAFRRTGRRMMHAKW